jgi:hypothetical protein
VRDGGGAAARAARATWRARRLKCALFRKTEHLHVKPGKGAAFVRTKLKNQVSGASRSRATVHTARVLCAASSLYPPAQSSWRLKRPPACATRRQHG